MPVSEILAPIYAVMKYHVGSFPAHLSRLYFDAAITHVGDDWTFTSYTDGSHPTGWKLHDIFAEIDTRHALDTHYPHIVVDEVQVWASNTGVNTFLGFDVSDYTDLGAGGGTAVPAAYGMFVFETSLRSQFRLSVFEWGTARGQRIAVPAPPSSDDGGINWFITSSAVGFVNRDNDRLTRTLSLNTGTNDKLARDYGRNAP